MYFDINYLLFVMLPTLVISGLTQMWVRGAYQKWSQIRNSRNVDGRQTAQILIQHGVVGRGGVQVTPARQGQWSSQPAYGATGIRVEVTQGELSDHFDPTQNVVRLSAGVATQPSVASMAITAHEFGHVQQYQENSPLMSVRSAMVPAVTLGSRFGMLLIIAGLIINFTGLSLVGLILFAAVALFSIVTLPVELDASRRAINLMRETGLIADAQDEEGAKAVLRAAAFTYVGAVATSLLTLLYWAMVIFGNNRRD